MTMKRKFRTDAFEAVHSAVSGMVRAGTINEATLGAFDPGMTENVRPNEAATNKKICSSIAT